MLYFAELAAKLDSNYTVFFFVFNIISRQRICKTLERIQAEEVISFLKLRLQAQQNLIKKPSESGQQIWKTRSTLTKRRVDKLPLNALTMVRDTIIKRIKKLYFGLIDKNISKTWHYSAYKSLCSLHFQFLLKLFYDRIPTASVPTEKNFWFMYARIEKNTKYKARQTQFHRNEKRDIREQNF